MLPDRRTTTARCHRQLLECREILVAATTGEPPLMRYSAC